MMPMQFTIRAIALATLWAGVCFTAFGLARSGVAPGLFFVLAVGALCGAAYALFKDSPADGKPPNAKAFIDAIVAWNVAIFVMMLAYPHTIGQLVVVTYERLLGDIHASYVTFSRIETYAGLASVTLPAALIGLWLFRAISHRPWKWRRAAMIIAVWEALVLLVLVSSYEIGFPYSLNQVGWAIFGVPDNIYSFTNLALPRIIAWFIETTPVAWTSLWLYSKFA